MKKEKKKMNLKSVLLIAGGLIILNGIGNYLFKGYELGYLLFMLVVGTLFMVSPYLSKYFKTKI